eukprot:TRINITY_DN4358_c0_g1::TRINITY_DN4358_c0_g1_i1::g.21256::m.21256 TRINITY_DN4358_c0_g1::TRINITY_DN4358_c0_g1_i1::g.21256  ORF type:complete len:398 (+),score=47.81,sp/Q0V8R7/NSUN4_BOVIN/33.51/4e-45,Nol1_Nop2_Fmu/PF01189.12/1.3e-25,FtsJ/PF01728.14/0.0013,Methyltransf_26/PF13659.1/8.2e+03,Methyltransf_26/PF13659.1/0.0065,Methyltransf_18/PF12847.2/0.084 TRINITY_DN4358_c0_g1_i1:3-1196(+)
MGNTNEMTSEDIEVDSGALSGSDSNESGNESHSDNAEASVQKRGGKNRSKKQQEGEVVDDLIRRKKKGNDKDGKKKLSNKEKRDEKEALRLQAALNLFDAHYKKTYEDRWDTLKQALEAEPRHCLLINLAAEPAAIIESKVLDNLEKLPIVESTAYVHTQGIVQRFPAPIVDSYGITGYYLLDAASVICAEALRVTSTDRHVLDMCAAPGGKTLVLLQCLRRVGNTSAMLQSNDISPDRRNRLLKVIREYVPSEDRTRVTVTGYDTPKWREFPSMFDKVLVDAPCSSERHLIHKPQEITNWKASRTQSLAKQQMKLLESALFVVKPGGRVVYSTCALSPAENDAVVHAVIDRRDDVEILFEEFPIGERTRYGWFMLPDRCQGWGPIYFAILKRKSFH